MSPEFTPWPVPAWAVVVGTLVAVAAVLGPAVGLAAAAAEEEPNDSRDAAQEVSVGEEVTGEIAGGDEDWFAFTVEEGEIINVSAAAPESDRSAEFNLITPGGNNLGGARLNGGRDFFGTTAATGGTYYINTVGVSPDKGGGPYSFTVETSRTDGFDPNEDRGNATRLYENPFPSKTATVSVGDREWFAFGADRGEEIELAATTTGDRGTEFDFEDPDGNGIAGVRLTDESGSATAIAETSGTHYLRTRGISPDRGGDEYSFTVDVSGRTLGLANDRFERPNPPTGNQDRANATTVLPGRYEGLAIVDDDRDVFAVELTENDRLRIESTFAHSEDDLALAVTDGSGTTLGSADSANDDEELAVTAPSGGTYYVAVSGAEGAATRYDLAVDVTRRVNVTVGTDGELAVGENGTLAVGVTNPSDAPVDGVEVAATGTDGLVVDPERRETGQLAGGDTRTVEFTIRGNASGEGTVAVSVATKTGSVVRISSISGLGTAFEQTPVSTDEPPNGPTPTAETASTEASQDSTPADGTGPGTETSGDGSGFGAGSLLIAVASLLYLLGRRGYEPRR